MTAGTPSLMRILNLEAIDVDSYRGASPDTHRLRVFGGQVAGQALFAAGQTVGIERVPHSFHAYFLQPGDTSLPIDYAVDRIRDSRSFSTRRVVGLQRGTPIFHLSASFHVIESGLDHQQAMPEAPPPEVVPSISGDPLRSGAESGYIAGYSAIDLRPVQPTEKGAKRQQAWLRVAEDLPDQALVHACAAAYASDLTLLLSALRRHGVDLADTQIATLDQGMWFHRPFRADQWLLYEQRSPSASAARGLAHGFIYTRDGLLVASVVQEGLMRLRSVEHGGAR